MQRYSGITNENADDCSRYGFFINTIRRKLVTELSINLNMVQCNVYLLRKHNFPIFSNNDKGTSLTLYSCFRKLIELQLDQ